MGTMNWTRTVYAPSHGQAPATMSSEVLASGAFGTTTSPAVITSLTMYVGEIFDGTASEDMWLNFGGGTAAVGTGHFFAAGVPKQVEIHQTGAVSTIDAA